MQQHLDRDQVDAPELCSNNVTVIDVREQEKEASFNPSRLVRLSYTFYSTLLLGLGSYTCAQVGAFNVPRTPFKEPRISCA
jgi:hypothetical protein